MKMKTIIPNYEIDERAKIGKNYTIRSFTIIYPNNVIGNNFTTGHFVLIREGNRIGNNVVVGTNSILEGNCRIGNNVVIHSNVQLGEGTIIEEGSWIGPGCVTLLTLHPRCKYKEKCNKASKIGKNVVVGANSIIMPGISVGDGAMIGAGSIVTKDVPAGMLAYGSPAKVMKKVSEIKCRVGEKYEKI